MTEPSLLATEAKETSEGQKAGETSGDSESTKVAEQTGKTGEETGSDEAKSGDEAGEEKPEEKPEGAPEKYTFTNPDNDEAEIDASIHATYEEVARELDLPQDKAQNLFAKTMSALHKRAVEAQDQQIAEWQKTAKADPEFGGDKLEKSLAVAHKAVDAYGSDGLRELLNNPHGVGNHPEVIRFLVKVGQTVKEDGFVGSDRGKVDSESTAARAKRMYPTSSQQ